MNLCAIFNEIDGAKNSYILYSKLGYALISRRV